MRTHLRVLAAALVLLGCSDSHDSKTDAEKDPFGNGGNAGSSGGTKDTTPVHDASGNVVRTTLPAFPGAGTSDAGEPLPNGMLCDAVAGEDTPIPERKEECYFDKNNPNAMVPAATLEQVLECVEEGDTVHIRLTFHPWFVDNTYGANAVGWSHEMDGATEPPMMMMGGKMPKMPKNGHTFKDLVGSDHAEIILTDGDGEKVMQFKLDYISEDASRPSGYGALGVTGGEGKVILGDASNIVRWSTSEDRNLNERGYASYVVDSPETDANYTANDDTPDWDYRVVYEAWIKLEAFGSGGFGGATIEYVHASPSKSASNTIEVTPGKCPPCTDPDRCHDNPPPPDSCTDPDGCHEDPPPPPDSCGSDDPDEVCSDAGRPPGGGTPVPDCEAHPEQCMVD